MSTPRDLFPHLYPPSSNPKPKSSDTASLKSTTSTTSSKPDPLKLLWCNTQWTNLSIQARQLGLPTMPYFDSKTMLLSRDVNGKMWTQLERLYARLGPEKAHLATPIFINGITPEVRWHSYLPGDKGDDVEVYDR